MCRYLESIKLKDGEFFRLEYHQQRMDRTLQIHFPDAQQIDLTTHLSNLPIPDQGLYKCRMVYDNDVRQLEFVPYQMRPVQTLKLIETSLESAFYKPEDRSVINQLFAQRGECDDVLIVKNGLLTDTSYCNIALYDGQQWKTPRIPIVYGTQRACLIDDKTIVEQDISVTSLRDYQKIRLFNAMIEFGELEIDIFSVE